MTDPNRLLTASKMMNDVQQRLFTLYVGIGSSRTISKLHELCHVRGFNVTKRMLDRWSAKWHWSELAKLTQQEIANNVAREVQPQLRELIDLDLKACIKMKERFHKRLEIDPFSEDFDALPEAKKELAIIPDLADYERVVRLEKLLLGDPEELERKGEVSRLGKVLGDNDGNVIATLRERTIQVYGLPDKDVIKKVHEQLEGGKE
jgi:hypothetical protein